eukprot:TRINITY_DN21970_c0_g1_i1.p1 TRINITY_DN21970_c0_g1~~TRINITY_DN21970_c0_g1_i1.p1  ORF type:complete len:355 (+),score=59.54 TRINITY_DN21970_c0_g1_i1:328-1392(+)
METLGTVRKNFRVKENVRKELQAKETSLLGLDESLLKKSNRLYGRVISTLESIPTIHKAASIDTLMTLSHLFPPSKQNKSFQNEGEQLTLGSSKEKSLGEMKKSSSTKILNGNRSKMLLSPSVLITNKIKRRKCIDERVDDSYKAWDLSHRESPKRNTGSDAKMSPESRLDFGLIETMPRIHRRYLVSDRIREEGREVKKKSHPDAIKEKLRNLLKEKLLASPSSIISGDPSKLTVQSSFFFGGPLQNAERSKIETNSFYYNDGLGALNRHGSRDSSLEKDNEQNPGYNFQKTILNEQKKLNRRSLMKWYRKCDLTILDSHQVAMLTRPTRNQSFLSNFQTPLSPQSILQKKLK